MTYNQPSKKPTRKVQAGALGGGLSAISMGVIAVFFPEQYALVPPGFEAGLATVIGSVVAYFARENT